MVRGVRDLVWFIRDAPKWDKKRDLEIYESRKILKPRLCIILTIWEQNMVLGLEKVEVHSLIPNNSRILNLSTENVVNLDSF